MKKKMTTVILTILVLVVWGVIAVRVWKLVRPQVSQTVVEAVPEHAPEHHEDTLMLDYRDPFLERRAAAVEKSKPDRMPDPEGQPFIPDYRFKYKGRVSGRKGEALAVIESDGNMVTAGKGESVGDVVIMEINPSFVVVKYGGARIKVDAQ